MEQPAADRPAAGKPVADRASDYIAARLDDQIGWYGSRSRLNRWWYHSLKVISIVAAGSIPILAVAGVQPIVSAVLGAGLLAIEGAQQLFQYQQNWVSFRATAEDLKREKALFLAKAGPYRSSKDPVALLAERAESLISAETTGWRQLQEEALRPADRE
jgi:hypothetical protein